MRVETDPPAAQPPSLDLPTAAFHVGRCAVVMTDALLNYFALYCLLNTCWIWLLSVLVLLLLILLLVLVLVLVLVDMHDAVRYYIECQLRQVSLFLLLVQ